MFKTSLPLAERLQQWRGSYPNQGTARASRSIAFAARSGDLEGHVHSQRKHHQYRETEWAVMCIFKMSSDQKHFSSLNNSWKIDAPIMIVAPVEHVTPGSCAGLCTRRNGACECCQRETGLLPVSSNPVQL